MFIEEAIWIKNILDSEVLKEGRYVLDIGSSTEKYRRLEQPFIDYYVYLPLRRKNLRIIHIDAQADEGVDVVCDLASKDEASKFKKIPKGDVVICSNLLEHLLDRNIVLERIISLANPGGIIILTVPYKFRYHKDPIDTMYRPSNRELEMLFDLNKFKNVASEIIEVKLSPEFIKRNIVIRVLNRIFKTFNVTIKSLKAKVVLNQVSVVAVRKIEE